MKKVVLNISDVDYEKFKFEAMIEKKNVFELLKERLFLKPFSEETNNYFDQWLHIELNKIINEE